MPKRRIAIILHSPTGSSGLIGQYLTQLGHELLYYHPLDHQQFPPIGDIDAVIVMGGKMSANDGGHLPELSEELNWIERYLDTGKPYLGVCLGAQLLAMVLGGEVTHHPERVVEIGYYPLYPTVEGFNTIFKRMPERFFQWHNEGFTLPAGVAKLAESDLYPNQAFRWRENVYAFQFHPEATLEQIQLWHQRDGAELSHPGAQTVNAQLDYHHSLAEEIRSWLHDFLTHWLQNDKLA